MDERSERLRAWMVEGRARLGMSQDAFADRLGYSNKSVKMWELGQAYPGKYAMQDLETLLGPMEVHDGQE